MNRHNIEDWLSEADIPAAAAVGDQAGGQAPTTDPTQNTPDAGAQPPDPNVSNAQPEDPNQNQNPDQKDDVSSDPSAPHMPDEKKTVDDFEVWKNSYLKESVKGDTNGLIELLNQVRDKDGLSPYQRKFVEDNWSVQLVRQHSNIEKASKEIRRNLKDQLDRNNPATSVVGHLTAVLETIPVLNNVFIKLGGYTGLKGDLHRKYIAALIGGVQVGSGANTEDVIFNERNYSILLSTRFNSKWGDVMLGSWSLKQDDPDKFLSDAELKRLQEGSPEEREVLRKRIVVESIADQFETRAFIINVVGDDGTIYTLGWDLASSLRGAYTDGKLVVKTRQSENSEAMINAEGEIVPYVDISINYVKETGQQDEDGKPEKKEMQFIERREGMLFLTAELQLIKEASTALQGAAFKEVPYNGNPSDLKTLSRCVYSAHDLLFRSC